MSLTLIEKKLSQLRGHIRLMFVSWGLAKLTIWASGLTLWLYYTDKLLKLPSGMRVAFLVIAIVILLVIAIRSLVYPLSRTLSDEDLALLVEREYPLLNDRLISSLQILKNQERYKDAASEDMIRAVVGESFDIAGRLQFNDAVRSRRLLYIVMGSILAMGLLFGHAWLDRDDMSIWVKRALGQGPDWPTATQLDVQILSADQLAQYPTEEDLTVNFTFNPEENIPELNVTGVYEVAANSDLRIIARPSGEIPSDAEIIITSFQVDPESGNFVRAARDISRPMERSAIGAGDEDIVYFSYNKLSITNPLEQIFIRAGDASAGPYTLRVIPAPELDDPLELTYTYPEYLMLENRDTSELPIDAVAGTRVEFRFSTTKPLLLEGPNASRLLVDFNVGSTDQIPINTRAEDGENHYTAVIPALRDGMARYRLKLVDRKGIENSRAIGDIMRVREDTPPTVRVLFSGDPLVSNQLVYVTRDAVLPIEFEMEDDYGIGSARMFWRLHVEKEPNEYLPFSEQFSDLKDNPKEHVNSTFTLDFEELLGDKILPEGRPSIEIYIQAFDLNSEKIEEGGETRIVYQGSRHHTLMTYEVHPIDELRIRVSSRIRQVRTALRNLLTNQRELLQATSDAVSRPDLLDFRGEDGQRLRNDLNEAYKAQNQALRDAEVLLREFGVFAQAYRYNRLERGGDLTRPQESRIQTVRLLLAIAAADRDLQQGINTPLVRLEEAEGSDLRFHTGEIIANLNDVLKRALPDSSYPVDSFGKLLQDTTLFSPGSLERSRTIYERLLEVDIKPSERGELLVDLEAQQGLTIDIIEAVNEQVNKWEGFEELLQLLRGLKNAQQETNEKLREEATRE